MLELGKRIEADEDVVSLPGTKQISEIKTIKEANAAFQSVLAKIKRLIETGQTPALSGDIKDLDAEISQLEERLFQAAKQGALTSYALKKELEVAKDFHKVLGSLNDYLDFQQNYSALDRQLDHSLGQVNDALFSDLHGLSTAGLFRHRLFAQKPGRTNFADSPPFRRKKPLRPRSFESAEPGSEFYRLSMQRLVFRSLVPQRSGHHFNPPHVASA